MRRGFTARPTQKWREVPNERFDLFGMRNERQVDTRCEKCGSGCSMSSDMRVSCNELRQMRYA